METNIKKIPKNVTEYLTHFVLLLVFWGGMIRFGFNADTLYHMVVYDADIETRLTHGRYLIALLDKLLFSLGIRTTDNVAIIMVLTLLIFAISMQIIQKVIVERLNAEGFYRYVLIIAMDFWVLNVLFSEILMFSEFCLYSAIAYLLGALTLLFYSRKQYILSIAVLLLGVCTYQYVVIFVAILVSIYICVKNNGKITKLVLIEELICVFSCIGFGFINLISTRILSEFGIISEVGKKAGSGNILYKLEKSIESFVLIMKHSYSMIPGDWIPGIIWLMVIILLCIGLNKKQENYKIAYILLLMVGSILLMYVIPLAGEDFFFPPRMAFTFYLLFGFLIAYGVSELDVTYKNILVVLFGIFLVINLLCVQRISGNRYVTNTLDEVYANMVDSKIKKYEETTGIEVTKIAIAYDDYAPFHYTEVGMSYEQINESSSYSAAYSLMKVFTGRSFEKVAMSEEIYCKYFRGQDWTHFDIDEQVIIIDDTVYWCLY